MALISHSMITQGSQALVTSMGTGQSSQSVASQGGLLINIDSATGDTPTVGASYIEDEKYGFYFHNTANAVSAEFDTAVTRTGTKTLKASTTNATGRFRIIQYTTTGGKGMIPIKVSTKYKFGVWVKSTNCTQITWNLFSAPDQANYASLTQRASLNLALGTTDWTYYTVTFTSHATDTIYAPQFRLETAGNISDAWFDINSMTLEEVVEPVANSLTTPSPSLVSFTAVGSTDNIDQSQLGVAATLSFDNFANYQAQQFIPTKSKFTGVTLQKATSTGSPSGTMTFSIVNDSADSPGTTVYATSTMSNATYIAISDNADFTVNLPCNLTASTKYWLKVTYSASSAVNFPKLKSQTPATAYPSGLYKYGVDGVTYGSIYPGDIYFKTLYYKPTTNFKASQNNTSISISADEDGFLEGAKIDLTNATLTIPEFIKTKWDGTAIDYSYTGKDVRKFLNVYSATSVNWESGTAYNIIGPTSSTHGTGYVFKIQSPATISSLTFTYAGNTTPGTSALRYSYDAVSWTEFATTVHATEFNTLFTINKTTTLSGLSTNEIFIEIGNVSGNPRIGGMSITGVIDTSTIPTLYNYPTNKDVTEYYTTTLSAPTTSATYRATKWGFPAIEYSATEYQYLNIDTTATASVVQFSEAGAIFTTVADGASLAISSTSNPLLWVRVNITANRIYASSNDYNAVSDKDGSMKETVVYLKQP